MEQQKKINGKHRATAVYNLYSNRIWHKPKTLNKNLLLQLKNP